MKHNQKQNIQIFLRKFILYFKVALDVLSIERKETRALQFALYAHGGARRLATPSSNSWFYPPH